MFGFRYRETMRGTYHRFDAPLDDRAMEFTIEVRTKGIRSFLRDRVAEIEGEITLENLADRRPLVGTLGFKLHENRMPYVFTFDGDDGALYRVRGQKDFSVVSVAGSLSTLDVTLYDASDREFGRGRVQLDLRTDGAALLKSLRPRIALG